MTLPLRPRESGGAYNVSKGGLAPESNQSTPHGIERTDAFAKQ
jgi:hypothetical protein